MIVTEIDHNLVLAAPTEGYVRTEGLHMSDLYNSLYQSLEPRRFVKGSALDLAKMEAGTSFEEVLEPALAARLLGSRPGEFRTRHAPDCEHQTIDCDGEVCPFCGCGIAYSPDYLFDIDGELVLGEFKLTWMSSKDAPDGPKFAKWHTQIMCYLFHLEITRCRLYAFFVNGDYKPPSPQLKCWNLRYTKREIEDEWNCVLRHGKKVGLVK